MHACIEIGGSDQFHCKRECDTQLDSKERRYDVTGSHVTLVVTCLRAFHMFFGLKFFRHLQ